MYSDRVQVFYDNDDNYVSHQWLGVPFRIFVSPLLYLLAHCELCFHCLYTFSLAGTFQMWVRCIIAKQILSVPLDTLNLLWDITGLSL